MNTIEQMKTTVVWTLNGAICGLLAVAIYNIVRTKLNEIKKK